MTIDDKFLAKNRLNRLCPEFPGFNDRLIQSLPEENIAEMANEEREYMKVADSVGE